jgi:hypothetical protein
MRKLIVAAVAVGAIAALSLAPQPAQARCSIVTVTAKGATHGSGRMLLAPVSDMPPPPARVGWREGAWKASGQSVNTRPSSAANDPT